MRSSLASRWLAISRCTGDVGLLQRPSARHAPVVSKVTWWRLQSLDVPIDPHSRLHARGSAVHLELVDISLHCEVLHTAAADARRCNAPRRLSCLAWPRPLKAAGCSAQEGCWGGSQSKDPPRSGRFGYRLARVVSFCACARVARIAISVTLL